MGVQLGWTLPLVLFTFVICISLPPVYLFRFYLPLIPAGVTELFVIEAELLEQDFKNQLRVSRAPFRVCAIENEWENFPWVPRRAPVFGRLFVCAMRKRPVRSRMSAWVVSGGSSAADFVKANTVFSNSGRRILWGRDQCNRVK